MRRIVLFANTDWYLYNFRLSFARALRDSGVDVLFLSPAGEYGHRLRELGFRWQALPMVRRSLNPFREVHLIAYLVKLLREEKPDLVHGFTIKPAIYGALAARLAGTGARVSAVAGMGYVFTSNEWRARLLRPWVRALFGLALGGNNSRLIVQNPTDLEWFQKAELVEPTQLCLIPGSGVDCSRFLRSRPTRDVTRRTRVLLPARLLWDKGIREFIEAARLLLSQGKSIDFLLAGEPDLGNPASVSASDISRWSKEGLVQWLGHVEDMPGLFSTVDIVTLPSYREGLPKGLIEAAACALPIITTDVPGCRDVVTHEVDGLLVPRGDVSALASAISRLHDDQELSERLGDRARQRSLMEFDEKIIIERTIAVYNEILPH